MQSPEPVIQRENLDEPALTRLAVEMARVLTPGDVVVLSGEVGVGKTTLVRAAARELGVGEDVTSPTYQLARAYRTESDGVPLAVEHLDLYRLEGLDPYDALDLDEHLRPDAIAFVEWAEPALGLLGEPTVVEISHETATTRRVYLSGPVARRLAEREAGWSEC